MKASIRCRPARSAASNASLDVVRRDAERLLAQHVLSGLEGADRPLDVHGVRERDVDRLDVGILEERLIAPVCALDLAPARVGIRPARSRLATATGRPGRDSSAREDEVVDLRRREDAPADCRVSPP